MFDYEGKMWAGILINLFSDLIFSLLTIAFFYFIYVVKQRKMMLHFFNISSKKKIVIYISNLEVIKFGSIGVDGRKYSFQGRAIPFEESTAAAHLKNQFNYFVLSQGGNDGLINKILLSDIETIVFPAPADGELFEQNTTVISIGLPPYNKVSEIIQEKHNPIARFETQQISEDINGQNKTPSQYNSNVGTANVSNFPNTSGSSISDSQFGEEAIISIKGVSPYSDCSIGFIQRLYDSVNNRNIFYVAGLSENSTAGSVYYLSSKWKDIYAKYGKRKPFLILLKVDPINNFSEVVFEK